MTAKPFLEAINIVKDVDLWMGTDRDWKKLEGQGVLVERRENDEKTVTLRLKFLKSCWQMPQKGITGMVEILRLGCQPNSARLRRDGQDHTAYFMAVTFYPGVRPLQIRLLGEEVKTSSAGISRKRRLRREASKHRPYRAWHW